MLARLQQLEREVERLRVGEKINKALLDTYYLGITAKAADSDKLDGLDSTAFSRLVFLAASMGSTSWDGDARSTTAKTKIDLSTVFGVPAGVKAVLVSSNIRDSGSANAAELYFILSPNNVSYDGIYQYCGGLANDAITSAERIIPCDANGDIYYQIRASGNGTMDIWMAIMGYWL